MSVFNFKRWILTNFIGWFLGVSLIIVISGLLDAIGIENMQFYVGAGMGIGIGLTQWWLMKNDLSVKLNWVLMSLIGMTLPFVCFDYIINDNASRLLPSVIVGAILTGGIQFLMLKKNLKGAIIWWPLASLGWIFSVLSVSAIDYTKYLSDNRLFLFFINLFLILSGGVILGISTGIAAKRLIKKNTQLN